jgi:predicted nucleic acid-binding OB-fold protein
MDRELDVQQVRMADIFDDLKSAQLRRGVDAVHPNEFQRDMNSAGRDRLPNLAEPAVSQRLDQYVTWHRLASDIQVQSHECSGTRQSSLRMFRQFT